MKTFKPILIFTLFIGVQFATAQNVYIPDDNFKDRLIYLGIDTNNDGEISYDEAAAITDELDLSTQQIADLTGIEAFVNITSLDASNNQLTNLDLSSNTLLRFLNCWNNQITSLDFSSNLLLRRLSCWNNQLTNLNFNQVKDLKFVDCSNNNLTQLNTSNAWQTVKELYCHHNLLSQLTVNQRNIEIIDCSYNQLNDLLINVENGKLKEVYCNNNNLSNIIIDGNNEIEILDGSYNSVSNIEFEVTINELNLNNNSNSELIISAIPFIEDLYIENNEFLEQICINHFPIHFQIHDNGSSPYSTYICNVPPGDYFYAGQGPHTFNNQWNLEGSLHEAHYDLNNDGENDIYFHIEVEHYNDYTTSDCYVTSLNNNLISSNSDYYIQGLNYGDSISPSELNWLAGEKKYFYEIEYEYSSDWEWYLEEGYFAVLIPQETDTTYCWVKINWNNVYYHPDGLQGFASWKLCINSLDLGEDMEVLITETIVLDAGEDFDSYKWNTGDTSQTIIIDCELLGLGNHLFNVLATDGGCYYTDTIMVQVVDEIGIDDILLDQIVIGPNPCKDFIYIQNPTEQLFQFEIIDITGSNILKATINGKSEKFNIKPLPSGIYFCRIYSAKNSQVFKLIKN